MFDAHFQNQTFSSYKVPMNHPELPKKSNKLHFKDWPPNNKLEEAVSC